MLVAEDDHSGFLGGCIATRDVFTDHGIRCEVMVSWHLTVPEYARQGHGLDVTDRICILFGVKSFI